MAAAGGAAGLAALLGSASPHLLIVSAAAEEPAGGGHPDTDLLLFATPQPARPGAAPRRPALGRPPVTPASGMGRGRRPGGGSGGRRDGLCSGLSNTGPRRTGRVPTGRMPDRGCTMGPAADWAVLCSEPGCTASRAVYRAGLHTGQGSIPGRAELLAAVPRAVPYAVPCSAPCQPVPGAPGCARLYGRAVPRSTCRAGPAPPPLRKPQAPGAGPCFASPPTAHAGFGAPPAAWQGPRGWDSPLSSPVCATAAVNPSCRALGCLYPAVLWGAPHRNPPSAGEPWIRVRVPHSSADRIPCR